MTSKKIPKSIHSLQQLKDIFALDPLIRDIDFSQWYQYVSMIIECDEYLGKDYFPNSVFQIKFKNINKFSFNIDQNNFAEFLKNYFKENDAGFPLRSGYIQVLSREYDNDNKSYYKFILDSTSHYSMSIEICFTDVEIAFLGEVAAIQQIEPGNCFVTSKLKKSLHLLTSNEL